MSNPAEDEGLALWYYLILILKFYIFTHNNNINRPKALELCKNILFLLNEKFKSNHICVGIIK